MRPWQSSTGESGISVVFGVAVFLGFLLFAAQVLLHLYATSTVTAVAFDAARRAAAASADGTSRSGCADEVVRARAALGEWGRSASLGCEHVDGYVTVTITGPSPAVALRLFERVLEVTTIERRASVRREGIRA